MDMLSTLLTYFRKWDFKWNCLLWGIILQELQNFQQVPLAYYIQPDMNGIYKLINVPVLIKKTSFDVKHCKVETVFILRSAQAPKLKSIYIWNT